MEVKMELRFPKAELIAMCIERCAGVATPIPGKWEAEYHYSDTVICRFVSQAEIDEQEREAAAELEAERNAQVAEPLREVVNKI